MSLPIFQIDAFTDRCFRGNPAAVVPLPEWLPDRVMQDIAAENNFSETAFFVRTEAGYHLRWFTPTLEVDLCGHATLATAWLLFHRLDPEAEEVCFTTQSAGPLRVRRDDPFIEMDFPARPSFPREAPERLVAAMGRAPEYTAEAAGNWMFVYPAEHDVRELAPDLSALATFEGHGVIATAPAEAEDLDFVSRYFVPACGVPEDPATGSAHCMLTPYWSARLGTLELKARQISRRTGDLHCIYKDDRVLLRGQAVLYLEGTIHV